MPKPGFFRRLLGAKKERDESDEFDDDSRTGPMPAVGRGRRHANLSFIPEADENFGRPLNPYHTNNMNNNHHRRGTRSCAVGRGLDDPTSEESEEEEVRSIHTDVLGAGRAHRHRPRRKDVPPADDKFARATLRDLHNGAHRRDYLDDEVAWSRRRIELLESKVDNTSKELYKVTNKWISESNRCNEWQDKYHRMRERYSALKQKYEDLQASHAMLMQHQMQQANSFAALPPGLGTPSTFANCSLLPAQQPPSAVLGLSPCQHEQHHLQQQQQQQQQLGKLFADERDSVKDFRGASAGARETLMSEASTSRVSNASFGVEVARAARPGPALHQASPPALVPVRDDGYYTTSTHSSEQQQQQGRKPPALAQPIVPRKVRRTGSV